MRITKKGLQAIRVEDAPTEAGAGEPNEEPTAQQANERKPGKSSSAPRKMNGKPSTLLIWLG